MSLRIKLFTALLIVAIPITWFLIRNVSLVSDKDLITGTTPNIATTISPPASVSDDNFGGENIFVLSPKAGEELESPFTIKGKARVFENVVNIILRGDNKSELYKDNVTAKSLDFSQYGDFEIKIPISPQAATSKKLTLEVFDYSAKDASVRDLVSIPIVVATKDTMDIKVYLINSKLGTDNMCTKTFSTKRQILKTKEVAYMALYQLIQGPNIGELGEGYDTRISGQVKINSVVVQGDTAYADFSEGLAYGITESCKVDAIKAQITDTLKQFFIIKINFLIV